MAGILIPWTSRVSGGLKEFAILGEKTVGYCCLCHSVVNLLGQTIRYQTSIVLIDFYFTF